MPSVAWLLLATLPLCGGFAIMLRTIAAARRAQLVRERLGAIVMERDPAERERGGWTALAVWIARRTSRSRGLMRRARLVRRAGFFAPAAMYEFTAVQVIATMGLAIGGGFVGFASYGALLPAAAMGAIGAVFGYGVPLLYVERLATGRQIRIDRELPFFVDAFVLLVRAGASVEQAFRQLRQLVEHAVPEVHRTLVLLVADLDNGKSYEASLRKWSERLGHRAGPELSGLLLQSLLHGTALAQPLVDLADREIERRRMAARERVGKRALHLTVVMVAFLLPPLLVLIGAPGVATLIDGLQSARGR